MPTTIITKCSNCDETISRWPNKSGVYACSRKCDGEYRRKGREKALKAGDRRGRLTLKTRCWISSFQRAQWLCICTCGTEKWISESGLVAKPPHATNSCGCLSRETVRNHIHGLAHHPLYRTHRNMMARCENPKDLDFKNYGMRGIKVCQRWKDVATFIRDIELEIGKKPSRQMTLDRINTDGNYEPGNVRWADNYTQQANKRGAKLYEFEGQLVTLSHLADLTGIDKDILYRNRERCDRESQMACANIAAAETAGKDQYQLFAQEAEGALRH